MTLDITVLAILFLSATIAFMRGFVREILTIGSLAGAAGATFAFGSSLTPMIRNWLIDPKATEPQMLFNMVPYEMVAPVLSYGLVFVGVLILLTMITHMISKGVHAVGLGPVDRSLGVVFGLVRGVIIIGLLSLVLNFVFSETQRKDFFGESKTYPYISYMADLTQAMLPGREVLNKKNEKKSQDTIGHEAIEPGQAMHKTKHKEQSKTTETQKTDPETERPKRSLQFNN
jgi:membrane protein required for colicin V production